MGNATKIQWSDSTANLMAGCDGCELWNEAAGVRRCYAGAFIQRFRGINKGLPEDFNTPELFLHRLQPMLRWKDLAGTERPDKPWIPPAMPRLIFLNDLGDTHTESLPLDWMGEAALAMADSPHVYQILTKRPRRMLEFWSRWTQAHGRPIPHNFWLLCSVTNRATLGRVRDLVQLRDLGASVLGVSYEPAWEWVDFEPWLDVLDWIIPGGESDQRSGGQVTHGKPFHLDWLTRLDRQLDGKRCRMFIKQLGSWPFSGPWDWDAFPFGPLTVGEDGRKCHPFLNLKDSHGGDWDEWPIGVPRRRDFPSWRPLNRSESLATVCA